MTAIDEEFLDVRFAFMVKKTFGDDMTRGIGMAFTREITRQLEQDIPIWENKITSSADPERWRWTGQPLPPLVQAVLRGSDRDSMNREGTSRPYPAPTTFLPPQSK